MFIDLLSDPCEDGGISLLGSEDEPVFLPDRHEFLVICCKLFQLRQTDRIRNAFILSGHIWEAYARKLL